MWQEVRYVLRVSVVLANTTLRRHRERILLYIVTLRKLTVTPLALSPPMVGYTKSTFRQLSDNGGICIGRWCACTLCGLKAGHVLRFRRALKASAEEPHGRPYQWARLTKYLLYGILLLIRRDCGRDFEVTFQSNFLVLTTAATATACAWGLGRYPEKRPYGLFSDKDGAFRIQERRSNLCATSQLARSLEKKINPSAEQASQQAVQKAT